LRTGAWILIAPDPTARVCSSERSYQRMIAPRDRGSDPWAIAIGEKPEK
jgi:hypothetical protein